MLNSAGGAFEWSPVFGLEEQVTGRLAPSNVNAGYGTTLFWDGRAGGTFRDPETGATILANGGALENQALGPPVASGEMAHIGRSWTDVAARVAASVPLALAKVVPAELSAWIGGRDYAALFSEAFGTSAVTGARIAMAIATYERTLVSNQTPFDALIAGTPGALTAEENAGRQLFGQLGCATCHAGALMSDNQFHYIGVRPAAEDSGRAAVTHAPQDLGAFRTPSLRNVGLRSAHMHDGRLGTLAEVVDFYDRGGDFNAPNKPAIIRPLRLNATQKAQLIAFLGRPLTDPRVAAQTAPFDKPTLYRESDLVPVVLDGGGVAGGGGGAPRPVAIEPGLTGNPELTIGIDGAAGGAQAVLVLDEAEPPVGEVPATASFARLETLLRGSGASAGYGSATLAIPDDPSLRGKILYGRWYVLDAGAAGGVAASPAFKFPLFGPNGEGTVLAVDPTAIACAIRLRPSSPNPFRPSTSTTLRFEVPATSRLALAVYDVSGRRVRSLVNRGAAVAGNYSATWDGRDDVGNPLPGGVYFYRLETDRRVATSRVVRMP